MGIFLHALLYQLSSIKPVIYSFPCATLLGNSPSRVASIAKWTTASNAWAAFALQLRHALLRTGSCLLLAKRVGLQLFLDPLELVPRPDLQTETPDNHAKHYHTRNRHAADDLDTYAHHDASLDESVRHGSVVSRVVRVVLVVAFQPHMTFWNLHQHTHVIRKQPHARLFRSQNNSCIYLVELDFGRRISRTHADRVSFLHISHARGKEKSIRKSTSADVNNTSRLQRSAIANGKRQCENCRSAHLCDNALAHCVARVRHGFRDHDFAASQFAEVRRELVEQHDVAVSIQRRQHRRPHALDRVGGL